MMRMFLISFLCRPLGFTRDVMEAFASIFPRFIVQHVCIDSILGNHGQVGDQALTDTSASGGMH